MKIIIFTLLLLTSCQLNAPNHIVIWSSRNGTKQYGYIYLPQGVIYKRGDRIPYNATEIIVDTIFKIK